MYKLVKNKIGILVVLLVDKIKVAFLSISYVFKSVMNKYYIYNGEQKPIITIKDIVS